MKGKNYVMKRMYRGKEGTAKKRYKRTGGKRAKDERERSNVE